MKLALNTIYLFILKAQKYLPVALMAYTVFAVVIFRCPPDGDGGTGR